MAEEDPLADIISPRYELNKHKIPEHQFKVASTYAFTYRHSNNCNNYQCKYHNKQSYQSS